MGKAEIKGSLFDELKRNDAAKKNEQNTMKQKRRNMQRSCRNEKFFRK